jgi:hypothetical protein
VIKDPGSVQDVGNQFLKQALVLPKSAPAVIANADWGNVLLVTLTFAAIWQKIFGD